MYFSRSASPFGCTDSASSSTVGSTVTFLIGSTSDFAVGTISSNALSKFAIFGASSFSIFSALGSSTGFTFLILSVLIEDGIITGSVILFLLKFFGLFPDLILLFSVLFLVDYF